MNGFIISTIYKEVLKKFPKGELEVNLYWEKDMLFFQRYFTTYEKSYFPIYVFSRTY